MQVLLRDNFNRKFTLFCREANFVENLQTFEEKIFWPKIQLCKKDD